MKPNTLICIDSCVFIRGLHQERSDARLLLRSIDSKLQLVIHRLIALEVTRNLTTREQIRTFYGIFYGSLVAFIVDGPVPHSLIEEYAARGLSQKGDAVIGAFAEWMQVDYLISDNRHFLRQLQTDAYRVATPEEFLRAQGEPPQP